MAPDSLIGRLLNERYQVLERLGRGGGGCVYRVEDQQEGQACALKLLEGFVAEDPGRVEYFRHEFALIARLRHPHLARALEFGQLEVEAGQSTPRYYYTTELVEGEDFKTWCSSRAPADWLLPIVQVLRVLSYIHAANLVHLDVKPGNLLVSRDAEGRPDIKLVDFGMVGTRGNRLDSVRGTIPYVAPEIVRGGEIDGRADLYSLGATLYEVVQGEPPFCDEDPLKSLERRLNARPGLLPPDVIEPELAAWIMKLLEPDSAARFPSAAEALAALPGTSETMLHVEAPSGIGYRQAPYVGNFGLLGNLERFVLDRLRCVDDPRPEAQVPRNSALRDLDSLLPSAPTGAGPEASKQLDPGRQVLAVVTGAVGIGKSRMLRELMLKVQLQGYKVLLTTSEQGPVAALQKLLREACPGGSDGLGLRELDASQLDDDTLRGRLVYSAAEQLLKAAEQQPLLWLIDDLDNLAGPVADMLYSLAFKIFETSASLAVVASAQTGQEAGVAPLLELDWAVSLQVPPLDLLATRKLVQSLVHHSAAEGPLLHQVTGGVPGWIELFICDLDERGQLRFDPDTQSWSLVPGATVQQSLAQVARRRASGIDPGLAQILAHLYLAGGPLRLDHLAICLEEEIGRIFERLCQLERMGLIERGEGENLRFSLRQEQVAAAAAELLDAEARRHVHCRLFELFAEELAKYPAGKAPVHLLERLARQADACGNSAEAARFAGQAARRSMRLSAVPSALQLAEIALQHRLPAKSEEDLREAAELFLLKAEGQLLLGEAAEAEATLRAGLELGAPAELGARLRLLLGRAALEQSQWEVAEHEFRAASEQQPVDLQASALASLGRLHFRRGRYDRAQHLHEQALTRMREAELHRELPAVLRALAEVHIEKGAYEAARQVLEEANQRSEKLEDLAGISESSRLLSQLELFQGRPRKSLKLALKAQDLATRAHLPVVLARALNQIGALEFSLGRFSNAMARYRACQAIFQRLGDKRGASGAANNLGCVQAMKGQLTSALESFVRSVHMFRELKNPGAVALGMANIASVTLDLGELGRAREAAEEAVSQARQLGGRRVFLGSLLEKARVLAALGELEEARSLAEEAVRGCEQIGNQELLAEALFITGQILSEQGELKAARQAHLRGQAVGEQAAALRNQLASTWLQCLLGQPGQALTGLRLGLKNAVALGDFRLELLARRLLGGCQLRVGDLDRALRSASTAAQMASRASMLKEIPEIGTLVAAIYIERGNLPQAARHAEEANRLAVSQGRPALSARALYLRACSRFDADKGRKQLLEARKLAVKTGAGGLFSLIDRQLSALLLASGQSEQALSQAERARDEAGDDSFQRWQAQAAVGAARAALGDDTGAAAAYRQCLVAVKELWGTLASPDSDRFLGRPQVQRVQQHATRFLAQATQAAPISQAVWLHDDLTGLYSHTYFHHRLQVELDRARRYDRPLALLMIGMSGLARLRTDHGERASRFVLGRSAERLRGALRSLDVPARLEDGRLAVILSDTDADGVVAVARRILERGRVLVDLSSLEANQTFTPQLCIGSVVFPEEADTAEGLIARCGEALRKALDTDSGHFQFAGSRPSARFEALAADAIGNLVHTREGRARLAFAQRLMSEDLSLESLFRALVELASPGTRSEAALYLFEEEQVVFRFPRESQEEAEPSLVAEARSSAEPVSREDPAEGAALALPVALDEQVRAVLHLTRQPGPRGFSKRERALAEALVDSLAQPLRTALSLRSHQSELARERQRLVQTVDVFKTKYQYSELIGQSEAMRKVFFLLDKMTDSNHSVVIFGESGTGKELVARAIHYNGPRKNGPFWAENCAAISESLLESELFGHVKGAFSGADKDKPGLFELASGGTVFLDEITEMPERMQKKLLRVLQEREVRPVGSRSTRKVDVRILASSNRDLKELVREGRFREDLYYRLNVISIRLPPLRERRSDILPLLRHFAGEDAPIRPDFLQKLLEYDWPGNVRELENEVHRLHAMGVEEFSADVLSPKICGQNSPRGTGQTLDSWVGRPLRQVVDEVTERLIKRALDEVDWHRTRAAEMLGIPTSTLFNKMKKYGLDKVFSRKPAD